MTAIELKVSKRLNSSVINDVNDVDSVDTCILGFNAWTRQTRCGLSCRPGWNKVAFL